MPINVTPNEGLSDHINDIRLRTARIVNERILPNESKLWRGRGGERQRRGASPRPRPCARRSRTR